jgi:hypothetical protein
MNPRTRRKPPVVRQLSPAEQARWDVDARFQELWEELGGEEREVLVRLAGRVLLGQKSYGRLCLLSDERDFEEERADEHLDAAIYGELEALRAVLRRRREASHAALRKLAGRPRRKGAR